jgi:hypothetical protein
LFSVENANALKTFPALHRIISISSEAGRVSADPPTPGIGETLRIFGEPATLFNEYPLIDVSRKFSTACLNSRFSLYFVY